MLYGVTIGSKGSLLDSRAVAAAKDIGLSTIRFQLPWNVAEKRKGNYDLTIWTDAINKCQSAGLKLIISLMQPPAFWQDTDGLPLAAGMAALAETLATHFKGVLSGIDLGNEDFNDTSAFKFPQLGQCLNAVVPAVAAIDPGLVILPGALLQRNTAHIDQAVTELLQTAGPNVHCITFHWYPGLPSNAPHDPSDGSMPNVPSFPQYVDVIRGAASAAGYPDVPILCTEFGWPTSSVNHNPSLVVDQATQAQYYAYVYDQAESLGLIGMFPFTLGFATPPDGMSLVQEGGPTLAYQQLKARIAGASFGSSAGGNNGGSGSSGPSAAQIAAAVQHLQQALTLLQS
jgi:hypothetical protein